MKLLQLKLPDFDERCFTRLRGARKNLGKIASADGAITSRLDEAIRRLKSKLGEFGRKDLANSIESPLDLRAFAKLLAQDPVSSRLIISDHTIKSFDVAGVAIKRQTLMLLVEAFLVRYDEAMDVKSLIRLGSYISEKLARFESERRRSALSVLAKNKHEIFGLGGPKWIVEWSRSHSVELLEGFEINGLTDYCEGRFFTVARYLYYLDELREIPVGSNHRVLKELTEKSVYMSPGDTFPHLGHEILTILIDRASGRELSDEWMRVILEIAGDPRVPEDSPGFRLWWSRLGADRIKLMRGWLSKLDLKLFLTVLNDYGNSSGDRELQRMYPSRKRFLEGLIDQGLVTNSRLFINPGAERFLKKGYKREDLPEYAIVRDTYRSMIYLQVGDLHMIEGSHSFKLWIFPDLPESSKVLNYQKTEFYPKDLSSDLNDLHVREFGGVGGAASITHRPTKFSWQYQAITYLRSHGIKLDIEKLFSKQDYAKYIRLKGL